ncbi:MAG TPA: transglycosylase SLT domain-containing protein [Bryobacteraceae bacterium]|nr:transglycosylase SLT domain-containing protein [Bryobacteraceae bacterium]
MSQQTAAGSQAQTWLLCRSGVLEGTRFPLRDGTTRVGRAPDNDAVIGGAESSTVSLYHAEIRPEDGSWRVRDLNSTNGTWLNGERITEADCSPPAVIQFGNPGAQFMLEREEASPAQLDRTVEISRPAEESPPQHSAFRLAAAEELLASAVMRARRLRAYGACGETMSIMRGVIEQALQQSRRRFRIVGYSLAAALVLVSSLAIWKIAALNREKHAIDTHIRQLEAQLQKANEGTDFDRLLSQLGDYQNQAESLQRNLLYRLGGAPQDGDAVTRELRLLMAEFGAEVYSIPPDFSERVNHYIQQDEGPDRPNFAHALHEAGGEIQTIRRILQEEHLPADLAYIPMVESALMHDTASAAGAAGPWQLTKPTAKAYGLRVDGPEDERKDLVKSTRAICKYLRDLILDFGAGSSVMLALAAYDGGTTKVKQAVSRTVKDPIKQRNFWYLYRTRALPLETREYVPKVFAAILIGRNPQQFGF